MEGIKELDPFETLFSKLEVNNDVFTPVRLRKFKESVRNPREDRLQEGNIDPDMISSEVGRVNSPKTFTPAPSGYSRRPTVLTPLMTTGAKSSHLRKAFTFSKEIQTFQGLDTALEIENPLNDDIQLMFSKIDKQTDSSTNIFYKSNSLWKIEGIDKFFGGLLKWGVPYRIRHFSSGKYLSVGKDREVISYYFKL